MFFNLSSFQSVFSSIYSASNFFSLSSNCVKLVLLFFTSEIISCFFSCHFFLFSLCSLGIFGSSVSSRYFHSPFIYAVGGFVPVSRILSQSISKSQVFSAFI